MRSELKAAGIERTARCRDLGDSASACHVLSAKQAERAIIQNLPPVDHHDEIVEQVGEDSIRVRLPYKPEFMGAEPWQDGSGRIFSGPMVMGFADTAMYCCVMASMGRM
jgi:acyl-coenzyme A thioesterase PaaI-like protein